MRIRVVVPVFVYLLLSTMAIADPRSDFEQARARWQSRGITGYSFNYQDKDSELIAPHCGGAVIRVRVGSGAVFRPIVVNGVRHCAKGASGKSIDLEVPKSIDDLFERIRRWIYDPPTRVDLEVTYDAEYGFPLRWSAVKPEISDSDEGFAITDFQITK
jgi:hypothetical protein